MACRVGITTRPEERKKEHENDFRNLRNWRIIDRFNSRSAAQAWEDRYSRENNCEAHGGGRDPDTPGATWYGYRFEHDGRK